MIATSPANRCGRLLRLAVAILASTATSALLAASASAAVEWTSEKWQAPTNLPPGGSGLIRIAVENEGDTASTALPTVSFSLPDGVTLGATGASTFWSCTSSGSPQAVTCVHPFAPFAPLGPNTRAGLGETLLDINVPVDIAPGAGEGVLPFLVTIDGDGVTATQSHTLRLGGARLPFGPTPGSFKAGAFDALGAAFTQAGGHPYEATTSFDYNTRWVEPYAIRSEGDPRDIVVDLPAGFVGDPTSGPQCQSMTRVREWRCAASTQVGVATIAPPVAANARLRMLGVYNVARPKDAPALLAFNSPVGVISIEPVLRSDGDWGLSAQVRGLSQLDVILSSSVTLWGVPADPRHDAQRCPRPNLIAQACVGYDEAGVGVVGDASVANPSPSTAPLKPFLTNPTRCSGQPDATMLHLSQYQAFAAFELDGDPDLSDPDWVSDEAFSPPLTGCDRLSFDPSVSVAPTASAPDAPSGLEFELRVPQNDDPDGLASAHLRNATVTLPEGMTVNPSSAGGLDACSSAQIGLVSKSPVRFTKLEPACPLASKIGEVEVETPLLDVPLTGDVFLARQADNPFDSLLGIYLVVRGPGILGKLAGHVKADPQTGRLSTTVTDNPQLPFDALRLELKGGERAPLTTPSACGTHTVTAALTSWAGHAVEVSDSFSIDCPGSGTGFDPGFTAGSVKTLAGSFSPFAARITRDGGKELGRVDMTLPQGALANLRSVAVCGAAQVDAAAGKTGVASQGAPACPAGSQVGTTTVGAGAGSQPFFARLPGSTASGRVFLTGPHSASQFKPAGFSQTDYGLAIEVPAVAGPFDLGTVLVRAAILTDPATAQVRVVSDRLPRILQGIPLNLRDVRVDVDRAKFATTPTSCADKEVVADIRAQDDTQAVRRAKYRVGDCAALRFAPRLGLRLTGKKQTRTGGHPGVRALVRQSGIGEAAIKRAEVRLPKALALDPDNAGALCEFADGTKPDLESRCPKGSIVGRAKAVSPLLKRPLTGNVYFVKNVRRDKRTGNAIRTLPMLVVALRGEVDINLEGKSSVKAGRLVNTFAGVPDAPNSRFNLNIRGGSEGIVVVTASAKGRLSICGPQAAQAKMDGHNGKRTVRQIRVKTPCAKRKSAKRKLRLTT
jgi:hypothetical protein